MTRTVTLLAETSNVDLGILSQYGILGLVAAGLIWFAKTTVARERDRADRLEAENRHLNQVIQDRVIPVLTSATNAAMESVELLRAIQRERELARLAQRGQGNEADHAGPP